MWGYFWVFMRKLEGIKVRVLWLHLFQNIKLFLDSPFQVDESKFTSDYPLQLTIVTYLCSSIEKHFFCLMCLVLIEYFIHVTFLNPQYKLSDALSKLPIAWDLGCCIGRLHSHKVQPQIRTVNICSPQNFFL